MLRRTYPALGERELLLRFWQSASGFWRGRTAWMAWLIAVALSQHGLEAPIAPMIIAEAALRIARQEPTRRVATARHTS